MTAERTKRLFACAAGFALAIGAVACGGAADDNPTPSVENGGPAASASPQEQADGFQIFPPNPLLALFTPPPPPPDGGVVFLGFTFPPPPPPPDGGTFTFTLPGLPPITLPGFPGH